MNPILLIKTIQLNFHLTLHCNLLENYVGGVNKNSKPCRLWKLLDILR